MKLIPNNRLLLLLTVLFYFCLMQLNVFSQTDAFQTESAQKPISPPIGIIGKAELTTIEIFWSNSTGFNGLVEGCFVYYWQTDQGFEEIQQANKSVIIEQKFEIENLRPKTEYSFAIRAATRQSHEKLEKHSEFFLSIFSKEYRISTKSDIKITLSMSYNAGGVFTISKYVPRTKKWYDESFFARLQEEIGKVRKVEDSEIDFRTGYVLKKVQMRTIAKESPSTLKFTDPRDKSTSVDLELESAKTKTGIIFEAILINSEGSAIVIKKIG
ncbi:MAG: fibronectin type III domain-containing protein [Candidatus Heimdallarchaeota archaeon]|nr:fibronectin type III domain-containing protein [Candidatus Heimdallarchaeota archaeon]